MKNLTYRIILVSTFTTTLIPFSIQAGNPDKLILTAGSISIQAKACWFPASLLKSNSLDKSLITLNLQETKLKELESCLNNLDKKPNKKNALKKYAHKINYKTLLSLLETTVYLKMEQLYQPLITITANRYLAEMAPRDVTNTEVTLGTLPDSVRSAITEKVLQNLYSPEQTNKQIQ